MRCRRASPVLASVAVTSVAALSAQELPPVEIRTVPAASSSGGAGPGLRYAAQLPAASTAAAWVPLLVVFAAADGADGARAALAQVGADVPRAGFVVASPVAERDVHDLRPLLAELRRAFRIDQGGMHALLLDPARSTDVLLAHRDEFQTVTAIGGADTAELARLRRLPARRVHVLAASEPRALAAHCTALHHERTLPGAAGDVARVLDDFHDAAANADGARYFAILPDDAVFLGTDATERWTGAQFRERLGGYFRGRRSAWTYVALQRHVDVEPGGEVAWFDERLDNAVYGECRGTGVLAKRDGKWVLRQYHLTVPVPNDLARDVAGRIRAFQDGVADAATTVVVVRHAEKEDDGTDPSLSAAGKARADALALVLRDLPVAAVYATQYRRTGETVAPLCTARGLQSTTVPAGDVRGLASRVRGHAGQTVVVCGHSNTVPGILKALGVAEPPAIGDHEYDRLFVVTLGDGPPSVVALRY